MCLPVYWKSIKKYEGVRNSKFRIVATAGRREGNVIGKEYTGGFDW